MDISALSIDHEVLTQGSWKYLKNISLDDAIATLDTNTNTLKFIKPVKIKTQEHKGSVINIQNELVNVFGTGLVGLFNMIEPLQTIVHLRDIEKTADYVFKTTSCVRGEAVHEEVAAAANPITVSYNANYVDDAAINLIMQGKHAVVYTSTYMNNNIYELWSFDEDARYKAISDGNDIVCLQKFFSSIVHLDFGTPSPTPFYTRRYGKPCWVVLTHPPADTQAQGQCHPMSSY